MERTVAVFFVLSAFLFLGTLRGAEIHVPGDQPTIQAGIDAAGTGDAVIVAPGTYGENIDFGGKAVTVRSEKGSYLTTIDGGASGSVVSFESGEGSGSVLEGFTITNGSGTINPFGYVSGGGIYCYQSSPAILNNIIRDNALSGASARGGGIFRGRDSDPLVAGDLVVGNIAPLGGGIFCGWNADPLIIDVTVVFNAAGDDGGGFYCYVACFPVIANAIFSGNTAGRGKELFVGDSAHPSVVTVDYSDIEGGAASVHLEPGCSVAWGAGVIDADPLFVEAPAGDFHLAWNSPCRDSGDASVPGIQPEDFEGDRRVALGSIDMGADEFYDHLYFTGVPRPGVNIDIRVTGFPGFPVLLALGAGIQNPPLPTPYGNLYLLLPGGPFSPRNPSGCGLPCRSRNDPPCVERGGLPALPGAHRPSRGGADAPFQPDDRPGGIVVVE